MIRRMEPVLPTEEAEGDQDIGLVAVLKAYRHALTVPEVTHILSCSRATLYRMFADREIAVFHTRRGVRVDPGAVIKWLSLQTSKPHSDGFRPLRRRSRR
jgi:excisionase family DNA binding protein